VAHKSALVNVMIGAALKAARSLTRDFGEVEKLQVSKKGPADFVSAADRRAEQVVLAELRRARPNFCCLSEEAGEIAGPDTSNRWIVDPLDGTTNFLHGLPHFAISIALERDRELVAGVVYDPLRDEMFWAERGQGAHLNDYRLRVSARHRLDQAVLATGIPHQGRQGQDECLAEMHQLLPRIAGLRRFGAASLDLAYVAAGRYEGFWERGLEAWDMAAGIVLVREAGGLVSDLEGAARMLEKGGVVVANQHLHGPLLVALGAAGDT
jgi:myo-inositol-1(or 4)-monophosphatase|tara:strand:- start:411 stop:1211 length:801 start_codon:yes stop_codon:yes gene_type:complete